MENNSAEIFKIDIEAVIKSKNPRLLRLLPRFVINYLKKILHQDKINRFLEKNAGKEGIDFAKAIVDQFNLKVKVSGLENVPEGERYIFAANHPQGAMDSMALVNTVYDKFGDLRFMVNDLLMFLVPLRSIFIPINLFGSQNREMAKLMDEVYTSNMQVLYYPAGLVSRKNKGVIKDTEWKKTFVAKARQYNRKIVPVYIHTRNSNFFYRIANLRRFLGIKANIEMFYLVDEMYKHTGKSIEIIFGKPIDFTSNEKQTDKERSLMIYNKVYELKNEHNLI